MRGPAGREDAVHLGQDVSQVLVMFGRSLESAFRGDWDRQRGNPHADLSGVSSGRPGELVGDRHDTRAGTADLAPGSPGVWRAPRRRRPACKALRVPAWRYDAPVAYPRLDSDRLDELIAEAQEWEELDYKALLDLRRPGLYDLVTDIAAMSVRGGYLVIGVADDGLPVGIDPVWAARDLDEANVRRKVERYLPDIDIRCPGQRL